MAKRSSDPSTVDQLLEGIAEIRRRLRELEALAVRLRKLERTSGSGGQEWVDSAHAEAARVEGESTPVPAMAGDEPPSVLVVEDEEVIRDLLRRVCEGLGCAVVEAERGRDAVELIEKSPVHLMLLDLHLPGGDGLELLKMLHRRNLKIPTIIVSAFISTRVAQQAKHLGVSGIVAKPFRMDRISSEIQRVLKGGGFQDDQVAGLVDDSAAAPADPMDDSLRDGLEDVFEPNR